MDLKIISGVSKDNGFDESDLLKLKEVSRSVTSSTRSFTVTVPAGTKCLVFGHHTNCNGSRNARISRVTFNGVDMTLGSSGYRSGQYSGHFGFWFLNNPPVGTYTMTYYVASSTNYGAGYVYGLKKELVSYTPTDSGSDVDGSGNPMVVNVDVYEGGVMFASWGSFNGAPSITYLNEDTTSTNYGAIASLASIEDVANKRIEARYLGQYYNQGLHVISFAPDKFK